ncbi:hypothetical protein [Candidatus Raskinella chloraquaticus]|uniref:hypothetical protein n=1 Tax=Candidatus Raskinella chloraquaticus TaxID=1951219 RepID=UPI0026860F40
MKMFVSAVVAMLLIIGGAVVVLEGYQKTVDAAFVGSGARPDPEVSLRGGKG